MFGLWRARMGLGWVSWRAAVRNCVGKGGLEPPTSRTRTVRARVCIVERTVVFLRVSVRAMSGTPCAQR